jgi:hypothetical protein
VLQATTTRFDPDDQIHRSTHAWHHFAGNYPAGQTPSLVNCKPPSQSWPPRITVNRIPDKSNRIKKGFSVGRQPSVLLPSSLSNHTLQSPDLSLYVVSSPYRSSQLTPSRSTIAVATASRSLSMLPLSAGKTLPFSPSSLPALVNAFTTPRRWRTRTIHAVAR